MKLSGDFQVKLIIAAVIVGGAAYVIYRVSKTVGETIGAAGETVGAVVGAVGDAAQAVNPLNNDNVINVAATGLFQSITGSKESIGGAIYDWWND